MCANGMMTVCADQGSALGVCANGMPTTCMAIKYQHGSSVTSESGDAMVGVRCPPGQRWGTVSCQPHPPHPIQGERQSICDNDAEQG